MTPDPNPIRITPADEAAIDALVEAGCRPDALPLDADRRARMERVMGLLSLLDHLPQERTGDLLAERTLRRIAAARQKQRLAQQVQSLGVQQGAGLRLGEMLALAAMLLVAVSILWPVMAGARGSARQMACQQNLAAAGLGFASYAADHQGDMPATRMRLGDPWWLTGETGPDGSARSNSANLFQLAKHRYAPLEALSCPENQDALLEMEPVELAAASDWPAADEVSFSYQNQYTANPRPLARGPEIAMLADKNPFFEPGRYKFHLGCDRNRRDRAISLNHAAKGGQNVLLTSGRVQWLASARIAQDNIYHVGGEGLDNYTGVEGPRDGEDSFLVW